MKLYKRFFFAVFYSLIYAAMALENIGTEGKGSLVFFAPLITWILVLAAIFLLSEIMSTFQRVFVAALLGVHYGVTALSVFNYIGQDDGHFAHSWNRSPTIVVLTIGFYMAGQFFIWFLAFRNYQFKTKVR